MNIDFKYKIFETVHISFLELEGCVMAVWFGGLLKKYEILYYMNGERRSEYFFEHELDSIKETKMGLVP